MAVPVCADTAGDLLEVEAGTGNGITGEHAVHIRVVQQEGGAAGHVATPRDEGERTDVRTTLEGFGVKDVLAGEGRGECGRRT